MSGFGLDDFFMFLVHNRGKMLKQILFLVMVLFAVGAQASIIVRQHADTIVSDRKILASDLNDEFNNLVNGVNSIDSTNIVSGSLTATNFAATSTAVSVDKKTGCKYQRASDVTGSKLVSILPPCEIFMDGTRGYLTATASISLINNLADGSLAAANYYYIYATRSTASLGFQFSQVAPDFATNRKTGTSTAHYIGFVRTGDATSDIASFTQNGPEVIWSQGDTTTPFSSLVATVNSASSSFTLSLPSSIDSILFKYAAYVSGFPAQCAFTMSSIRPNYQGIVIATGGHTGVVPFWIPITTGANNLTAQTTNISNCVIGGDLRVIGIRERSTLHY